MSNVVASLARGRAAAAFLSLVLCSAGAGAQNLDAGLVARYAFEGNAADSGPNGWDGAAVNGPRYVAGIAGRALDLDGIDDHAVFAAIPNSVFNAGDFSISLFVRMPTVAKYSLVSKRDACTQSNHFDVRTYDIPSPYVNFELSRTLGRVSATAPVAAGEWTHVALVREGGNARVYVDARPGADVATGALSFGAIAAPFALGDSPCVGRDGTQRFEGQVDELRVYARALSAAEVRALSQVEGTGSTGGVTVTPPQVNSGATVQLTAGNVSPLGRTCRGVLFEGRTATDLGPAQPSAAGAVSARLALPQALAAGTYAISLQCTSLVGGAVTDIGRDSIEVRPGMQVELTPASGFAGTPVQFSASAVIGQSFELWYDGVRVYGPAAVRGDGTASGRFIVPRVGRPLPAALRVDAYGLSGRLRSSSATTSFNQTPKPAFVTRVLQSGIPASIEPDRTVVLDGRIEADDGQPQRRTINVFLRDAAGRVVPLGSRDVVPGADGRFGLPVRLPARGTLDGFIARGPAVLFYTWTAIDPATGALGVQRSEDFPFTATGYAFNGNRIELTVRSAGDPPQPLPYAYVRIGTNALDEPDPAQPDQMQFGRAGFAGLSQVSGWYASRPYTSGCPVSLAAGFTDSQGRFTFEVDESTAQLLERGLRAPALGSQAIASRLTDTTLEIYTAHLGYGSGTGPTVRVASYDSGYDTQTGAISITGGRFLDANGNPLNSNGEPWRPVVTLSPITPALVVRPSRVTPGGGVVEMNPIGAATYDAGRFFDLRTVPGPRGCGANEVCVTGTDATNFTVVYQHNRAIGGVPSRVRMIVCANDSYDCAGGNVASIVDLAAAAPPTVSPCNDTAIQTWSAPFAPLPQRVGNPRTATIKARLEVQSTYTPPGGGIGRLLDGRANLRLQLDRVPGWLSNGTRFTNRAVSQSPTGETRFSATENLSGGTRAIDSDSGTFAEYNLDNPQRNNTRNQRTLSVDQTHLDAQPSTFDEVTSDNTVASNAGEPLTGSSATLGGSSSLDTITIIDTGTIPLFRMAWGLPPVASATLGADFFLKAGINYGGEPAGPVAADEPPGLVYITEPFSRFGIDLFFDLSAVAGLVSASATASAKTYLSNKSEMQSNGVFNATAGQCAGFKLTAEFEVCAVLCASTTEALIEKYAYTPETLAQQLSCADGTSNLPWWPNESSGLRRAGGVQPRPVLANRAGAGLAIAADGTGGLALVEGASGAADSLRFNPYPLRDASPPVVVETRGNAVTSTAVAAFGGGRGLLLWSYVPEDPPAGTPNDRIEIATQRQQIRWATYASGQTTLLLRNLTPAGSGDGNVVVAWCDPDLAIDNCPSGGEATAVWVRRIGARYDSHHYALMYARYRPSTGWTTPARVDSAQGAASDLQPAVSYWKTTGVPVVAWVRKASAGLADLQSRQLAYRFLDGSSPVRVAATLPSGISWPALTTAFVANGNLLVERAYFAYTVNVDPVRNGAQPRGFLGNTNALHVAEASAAADGLFNFSAREVRDARGRNLRVEKPNVIYDGGVQVVARGLGFGPPGAGGGVGFAVEDPIGMVSGQGTALLVRTPLDGSPAALVDLDADALGGFQAIAGLDPVQDAIVQVSRSVGVSPATVRAAAKSIGLVAQPKATVFGLAGSDTRMSMRPTGTDVRLERASAASTILAPGGTVAVSVRVRNLGAAFQPDADRSILLVARWDAPAATGDVVASLALQGLDAAQSVDRTLQVPVPAGFARDEPHTLVLSLEASDAVEETDASDNQRQLDFNAMPRPQALRARNDPGFPHVYLAWDIADPADDRVAGYRVFRVADDGERIPLGATPVRGFADLLAPIGQRVRYVVVSYSAGGVQSEESEVLTTQAMPAPGTFAVDDLFRDSFEPLAR